MNTYWIVGACILVLLVGALRSNVEWILNIVLRSILGTIAIYFINQVLAYVGIDSGVGINAITILTCGFLGFPGVLTLYGIGLYKIL